ncbi:zinc-binding dehydrogenase [Roseovarius atlanticus]|uniref:zinc-binding dehydrogenase n=1 Tax=Roseovarius atlanticus TaxID=1641875 RepID=UPI001C95DA7B|nr:zinc-binding dehydrogenase [Roseovarius atlanticus]MBY5988939.1 zinc-binding dehydrogenase [Roseovarius atlanticus]MBY6124331.1 zinc-binding dehydrogenase [Roseovarius atlanticus]MBY6148826.1 zinc-binding dehydrogenase [Roseovarius atlanticus]
MKAALHDTFGDPAKVLYATDTDTSEPGEGQVRIKTLLSPIHNHDLWTVRGTYGYKPSLPGAIGGSEAAGIVDAVGAGVDDSLKGQRVAVAGVHGTWAEHFLAPANGLMPLPEQISNEQGAQLIAMPFSAISLLDSLKADKGDWIVQTAANGAVGRIVAVLAAERGINLVNLVRREEAAQGLRDAGTSNVISTSDDDWTDRVRQAVGDGKLVSAIDSVGGDIAAHLVDVLSGDGELIVFGTATGDPMPLSSGPLIMKQITIKGFWGARVGSEMDPDHRESLMKELVTLAVQGKLPLATDGTYSLDQITDAVTASLTPGRDGKVMLKP